jgi:hypothetical protein
MLLYYQLKFVFYFKYKLIFLSVQSYSRSCDEYLRIMNLISESNNRKEYCLRSSKYLAADEILIGFHNKMFLN